MEAFAMSVRGFRKQKRWGTRTFDEGMQTNGESEEDGMEGACGGREVLPVGLLTRPRSDRGRSCERVTTTHHFSF